MPKATNTEQTFTTGIRLPLWVRKALEEEAVELSYKAGYRISANKVLSDPIIAALIHRKPKK